MGKGRVRLRVARVAVAGSVALVSAGALALAGAAPASAAGLSGTVPYNCNIANLIHETIDIGVNATAASSVGPGGTITLTGVQSTTVIPSSLVDTLISALKITSIAGTVTTFDLNATNATPATINAASTPLPFSVTVHEGQNASITVPSAPETVGPFTAASSGTVTIVPGEVLLATKDGSVTCTAPSTFPTSEVISIPISSATSSSTPSVPATHTGEPWAGWPYWALVGLAGVIGLGSIERATRIRRRRA